MSMFADALVEMILKRLDAEIERKEQLMALLDQYDGLAEELRCKLEGLREARNIVAQYGD